MVTTLRGRASAEKFYWDRDCRVIERSLFAVFIAFPSTEWNLKETSPQECRKQRLSNNPKVWKNMKLEELPEHSLFFKSGAV